jgi:hypothetical protein
VVIHLWWRATAIVQWEVRSMEWQPYWEFMQRLSQTPPATLEEYAGAVDRCHAEVQPTRLDWRGLDRLKSKLAQGECLGFIGPTWISAPRRRR